jgi:hypothetical protein
MRVMEGGGGGDLNEACNLFLVLVKLLLRVPVCVHACLCACVSACMCVHRVCAGGERIRVSVERMRVRERVCQVESV